MAGKEEEKQKGSMEAVLPDASILDVKQGAPAAAATPPKLKRRLTKGEIMSIIALKPEPFPSADYLDELAEFYPPEWIAEKKRQHEEDAAYFGDRDEKCEAFRQKVIKGLNQNGYYEIDVDFIAARKKANQYAKQHARKPFLLLYPEELRSHLATPEQMQQWIQEGSIREYVPDEEDARLISYGDSDASDGEDSDASDDEEDSDASDEVKDALAQGADAHKDPAN